MTNKLKSIFDNRLILHDSRLSPYTVEIDPTNNCTLRCSYCIWSELRKRSRAFLDEGVFRKLISDLIKLQVRSVVFTGGGEPLCHPFTPNAITMAKDGGIHVGLFTNGTLLNRKIASLILPSLSWVRFNLSSSKREIYKQIHGVDYFNRVINNIRDCVDYRNALKLNTRLGIGCVVSSIHSDINMVRSIAALAINLRLDFIQFKHDLKKIGEADYEDLWKYKITPILGIISKSEKEIAIEYSRDTYINQKELPCFISKEMAVVKADGSVCLCKLHRDLPAMCVGNINKAPVNDILSGCYRTDMIKKLEQKGCNICCAYKNFNQYVKDKIKVNNRLACSGNKECDVVDIQFGDHVNFI